MKSKKELDIKVSDFGFAKSIKEEGKINKAMGTAYYLAPELI